MTKDQRKKSKVKIFTKNQKPLKSEIEYIKELQAKYNEKVDLSKIKSFKDFPLCAKTLKGLRDAGYKVPTEIQKETIMLALRGNDILGAAQTGSGKTLAFLIPLLEKLFCKQWTHLDRLGALIITPTRELALQIFETLKKIGVNHDFSCGLIIGGKDLKMERNRMDQCNIIICTPGRLLQHMDENPLFDAVNLQILILDEADRCLDMGFKATMNAIIANLPLERQTLLFSATQTKSVKDLARLNLKDASYVSVHEHAAHSTPDGLEQSYTVCELEDKVAILWSFIKNHLKKKCIVFLSTCKQVKFIFEIFSKMRPGVTLMALYGRMHQMRRMKIYEEFTRKTSAILFATDIVARGLDFPEVHWVVQVDCPEDADTYIHRVGRTARFHKGGESLLLLMPSELKMLEDLEKKKIPINKIDINKNKIHDPVRKIEAYTMGDSELQNTAKRAFVTYLKSIYKMKKRRDIFNVEALNFDAFANSYGLTVTPRLRFLKEKEVKESNKTIATNPNKIVFDDDGNPIGAKKEKGNSDDEETNNPNKFVFDDDGNPIRVKKEKDDSDDEIETEIEVEEMKLNRLDSFKSGILKDVVLAPKKPITKVALLKKSKNCVTNKKIKFDEEGNPFGKDVHSADMPEWSKKNGIDKEKYKMIFSEIDNEDKKIFREKSKAKRKALKRKLKEQKKKEKEENVDFGKSGSEEDEDVDLSWVPDPDKVYGDNDEDCENTNDDENSENSDGDSENQETSDNENGYSSNDNGDQETSDEESNEYSNHVSEDEDLSVKTKSLDVKKKRRKMEELDEEPKKKKHKVVDKIENMASDLTLNEAEQFALMLIQK